MRSSSTSSSFSSSSPLRSLTTPSPPSPPPSFWRKRTTTNPSSPLPECRFPPFQLSGTRSHHGKQSLPRLSRERPIRIPADGPNPVHQQWAPRANPTPFPFHPLPCINTVMRISRATTPTIPLSAVSTTSTTRRLGGRRRTTGAARFAAVFGIRLIVQQTTV